MRVRIATKAWAIAQAATRLDGANACVDIPWVEIDGHRYNNVISANIGLEHGVQTLELKLVAATDIVIVDAATGEPFPD